MKNLKNIRHHWLALAAIALALPLVTLPVSSLRAGDALKVEEPHVRVTIPGRPAAGYMTVKNSGTTADAITAASSPLAKRIELHEHSMDGGIMRMRQVEQVEVPAAGEVVFSSGGYHLMISGLDKSVKPGDALPVTLTLKSGKNIEVDYHVGKVGDPNNPYGGQHKH